MFFKNDIVFVNADSDVAFFSDDMGLVNVDLSNVGLNGDNFNDNDPEIVC